jgi:hypothetical protein
MRLIIEARVERSEMVVTWPEVGFSIGFTLR